MQIASRVTQISVLALGIAGALAVGQAQASGFQLRENSVKNLGRSNSGTAVAQDDASVVANNPAAMVNLKQNTVQADVSIVDLSADFTGGGVAAAAFGPAAPALTGGNGGDPGSATAVPALAAVFPLHGALEDITIGASIHAPFGLKTEYDRDWVGRYNAIKSDVKTVDFTLSAALALTDRFSVGLGWIYQQTDVTLSNAIDFGTALCAGSGNPLNCFNPAFPFHPQGADGSVEVTGDDNSMGWIAGAQWRPTDSLSIGYSHRSEIDHDIKGDADFAMPASVAAVLAATGSAPGFADGPVFAPLTTPSIDTLSAQWDINADFRLMADVQWTDWHSLRAVDIYRDNGARTPLGHEPFNWDDTVYYSLGAEWDLSDAFTLRAGLAKDQSPTNDATRTPRLPDEDRNLFSLGLTWHATPALSFDAAYQRIEIDDPSVNVLSSSGSRLTGTFDGHADLFGVAAQYRF